ncbi:MAG TPA: amidohydrolase family protein [Thermoleophilaceae bacterium]|jgi:predicted TIM-barrel fold metal-dependent hydrolase
MYSDDVLRPWRDALVERLPRLRLFDVHTHIGDNDPDGLRCSPQRLVESLELADARGVVFPMHEPDGYPPANDRVIAEAGASDGRLVPFCRLDPAADPLPEAERALARGARGIKLHPRAERFRLADERLEPVFALAGERRLPVIVHAGRGIPALGRDALDLTGRHPGMRLILAHAGVCDLGWIWRHAADRPNLFFDTAWWSAVDHLALFGLVPPGQILFGSDVPYGTPLLGAILTLRPALQAGLSDEQVAAVAGGQLERLLDGEEPLDLGPPPGSPGLVADVLLQRIHGYLVASIGRMFLGHEGGDYVGLARLACEVGEDPSRAPVAASVLALLDRMESFSRAATAARPGGGDGQVRMHPGVGIAIAAATVALTPAAPLPELPDAVDVSEREAD